MKRFRIYGFNTTSKVLITNSSSISPASTFDENLTKKDNDRATLSFKIMKNILFDGEIVENYFINIIKPFAKIRYEDEDTQEIIDFIITDISYKVSKNTIEYSVVAEDYVSQIFAKIAQGLSIDQTGNIYELGNQILKEANKIDNGSSVRDWHLKEEWTTTPSSIARDFNSVIDKDKPSVITFKIENSNLYNSLIELGLLFNATLKFNYITKEILFINKAKQKFNGYRLRGDINLTDLAVKDNIKNFTTFMNVVGGKNELTEEQVSLISTMPIEIELFFQECIENDFKYFNDYYVTNYSTFSKYIIDKFLPQTSINYDERKNAIIDYLKTCDITPHLTNAFFDIGYFYYNSLISKEKYDRFNNFINNDIRKLNIKIALYFSRYYVYYVKYSSLVNSIREILNFSISEAIFQEEKTVHNIENATITNIDYELELNRIFNSQEYIDCVMNLFGNESDTINGFNTIIEEIQKDMTTLSDERVKTIARINEIDALMANMTEMQKIFLNTEREGLESRKQYLNRMLGYDTIIGEYPLYIQYINSVKHLRPSNPYLSLYDLLINMDSSINLIKQRNEVFATLYAEFSDYIVETTYTNEKELDSKGLLEQAYFIFFGKQPFVDKSNRVLNPYLNLISNGTPGNYKPGWNTTLHNDAITVQNWTTGYNDGVSSPSVGYHARFIYGGVDGPNDPCVLFQDENSQFGLPHRWMGVSCNIGTASDYGWQIGDQITISWYQKTNVENKGASVGLYHYNVNTGERQFGNTQNYIKNYELNKWRNASFTFTIRSDFDLTKPIHIYIYGNYGEEGKLWVDNISVHRFKGELAQYYVNGTGNNCPNRIYDVSVIDLSSLDNYRYLVIKVGDRVELSEEKLGIVQEQVRISEISMPLREPNNAKLIIDKINEEDIIQKLLLNL